MLGTGDQEMRSYTPCPREAHRLVGTRPCTGQLELDAGELGLLENHLFVLVMALAFESCGSRQVGLMLGMCH